MNGIIHQCSHPNDDDVHFRISEDKIFADIFHYLEVLFRIIKPRKVFFMAVDGVAPRAKMNQQRGRRFRFVCACILKMGFFMFYGCFALWESCKGKRVFPLLIGNFLF